MKEQKQGLELFNAASSVGLLHLIHTKGEVTVSELRDVPGGYDRLKRVAQSFEDAGLVEKETIEKPYLTYIYRLTEKGKKVAEKLSEIDSIVKGE